MIKSVEFDTSHDSNSLSTILSDPDFVLPRLFPPIKQVTKSETSFDAKGRFMGMKFNMHGNVLKGTEIIYAFHLGAGGGEGEGRLTIRLLPGKVALRFEYEGWMERVSGIFFMQRWFENFGKSLEEEVRMERIKRKL